MTVTIFHNPACGTSRETLALIREAGIEPRVVEYLKEGWTRPRLTDLLAKMDKRPRDILRVAGTSAEALGLTDPAVADETIIEAMIADPLLVQRPIVATPRGVALCRPAETVRSLLPG